jgi:hypothetical protein
MTTSPQEPDDDAPPMRDEEFDEAGRFVGDETPDPAGEPGAKQDDEDGLD